MTTTTHTWDYAEHMLGGERVVTPSFFQRISSGWKLQSETYPVCKIFFRDEEYQDSPSQSAEAAIRLIPSAETHEAAIIAEWIRRLPFPSFKVKWSEKLGRSYAELIVVFFSFKDPQGNTRAKTHSFQLAIGEQLTQRRMNVACENAMAAWINYLVHKEQLAQSELMFTDFTRHSNEWRQFLSLDDERYPKAADYPAPSSV
ncbi:hypothetical protein ACI2KR_08515 [Pseudomonas luteola]